MAHLYDHTCYCENCCAHENTVTLRAQNETFTERVIYHERQERASSRGLVASQTQHEIDVPVSLTVTPETQ